MLLKAPPSVLNNHHFTEKVALVFVHRFKVNPSSSKSSSEQETIPTHNKLDLNKRFQVKLLYFLCWKFHPLLWSFLEELDLGAVIWVLITQQARSSCSFRDQGGSYSVETYSDDYFKQAMTLRWAVSQPPSIVRNWKLMVRRRMGGQQQPTYQSLSDVSASSAQRAVMALRGSAALGDRRLATFQGGVWLSSESAVGMWIGHNVYPRVYGRHIPLKVRAKLLQWFIPNLRTRTEMSTVFTPQTLFRGLAECYCTHMHVTKKSCIKPFVDPEGAAWSLINCLKWCHWSHCRLGLKTKIWKWKKSEGAELEWSDVTRLL